ncbi:MAG: DUF502 domain-containing protein [Firmicutes bacterium]|nr:DUF502 domain-containing protein [Bacillota bacterium]
MRKRLGARLRAVLFAGVAALLPIVSAVYVVLALFRWVDGLLRPLILPFVPEGAYITGLGAVVTTVLVFLVGLLVSNYVGSRLFALVDWLFRRMPIVSSIYGTVKQFIDSFGRPGQPSFKRVALVEYPRKGLWRVALITGDTAEAIERATGEDDLVNVYLPTTPNPASGVLLMVPRSELRLLDMSVEAGMRLVISGGIVNPEIAEKARSAEEVAAGDGKPAAR